MKKFLAPLFTAILIIGVNLNLWAQTQQSRQVSGFNGISASSSFNVHVKIDGTESVKVSADESIINDIETVVESGTLKIRQKNKSFWNFRRGRVDIYVTAKSLSTLSNSGSGNIQVEGNLTGNAEIKASGSGNVNANVNGTDLHLTVSGSGNITSEMTVNQLAASVSGSGSLALSGNTKNVDVKVSGSGAIRAAMLKTDAVNASISGSGNIRINAEKSINAHVSGSGNLTYTGNATMVNIQKSGSGRVSKG